MIRRLGLACLTMALCLIFVTMAASQTHAQTEPPVHRGDRLLGLAIIETKTQSYGNAMDASIEAGSDYIELVVGWDDVETAPGAHNPRPDFAQLANGTFPAYGLKVALSFLTFDTVSDRRPAWHQNASWDDPEVIEAAWRALNRTIIRLRDAELISVSLGNEVDVLLTTQPAQQAAYLVFIRALKVRMAAAYPTLPVGVKVTAAGALALEEPVIARQVTEGMDLAMITYYPLDAEMKTQPIDVAVTVLDRLVGTFPDQPIHLAEIGYPSDPACGDGPEGQADFVYQVFQRWDRYADRIKAMNWVWQTDIGPDEAANLAGAYGSDAPCFVGFLGSLGLRNHDLSEKSAWPVFRAVAFERGFTR
ncbi:MAG: hypothetical protein KI792_13455 [Alphaproteobacteria bacterium]|nr:hypothetical protein [Alphaproteobacteria bacterium SS10]